MRLSRLACLSSHHDWLGIYHCWAVLSRIVRFPRIYYRTRPLNGIYKHHNSIIAKQDWGITKSMQRSPEMLSSDQVIYGSASSSIELNRSTLPVIEDKADTPRYLI